MTHQIATSPSITKVLHERRMTMHKDIKLIMLKQNVIGDVYDFAYRIATSDDPQKTARDLPAKYYDALFEEFSDISTLFVSNPSVEVEIKEIEEDHDYECFGLYETHDGERFNSVFFYKAK